MTRLCRSLLFDASFYLVSIFLMVIFLPLMLLPQKAIFWAGRVWVKTVMKLLEWTVGLSWRVEGIENLPPEAINKQSPENSCQKGGFCLGGYIIACKHESAWETLIFHILVNAPAFALKQELMWVPLINLYFWRMGMLAIDRGRGASSLKNLIERSRHIITANRPLVIFPEGNRSIPGKQGDYKTGVAALYRALEVPVIPVALNSGTFWGRRSLVKRPGEITIKFLPPIQPGLPKSDLMAKLADTIDTACDRLNGKSL